MAAVKKQHPHRDWGVRVKREAGDELARGSDHFDSTERPAKSHLSPCPETSLGKAYSCKTAGKPKVPKERFSHSAFPLRQGPRDSDFLAPCLSLKCCYYFDEGCLA